MAVRKTSMKALMRLTRRKFKRNIPVMKSAFVLGAGGAVGGSVVGAGAAPAGLKTDGAKLGALEGGFAGAAIGAGSAILFRRVRGRIIPIRVKR